MEYAQLTPGPGFDAAQSFLYYSQRLLTKPRLRQFVLSILRARISAREGAAQLHEPLTEVEEASLRLLSSSGYAPLRALLSRDQVADIHAFLQTKNLRCRDDKGRLFTINNVPEGVRVADYGLRDIIDCPHILELANSPSLLRLASRYIGCKPTISALGLRWSFPSHSNGTDVQAFHRDSDDWRYVKIFVYLTDVCMEAGPHVYVSGTHLAKAPIRLRFYNDDDIRAIYGPEQIITVTGPIGFGFAADTAGIHKGMVPTRNARLMLQIQYSVLPAYAYRYNPEPYEGSLQLDSYINRLILK